MIRHFLNQISNVHHKVSGVGLTVINRLERMCFSTLEQLSETSYDEILISGVALTSSRCWKNSPQAKKAVERVIAIAKQTISENALNNTFLTVKLISLIESVLREGGL